MGARRLRRLAGTLFAVPLALAVLVAGVSGSSSGCAGAPANSAPGGSWLATAYGPPWTDGNGAGITATGFNATGAVVTLNLDPTAIWTYSTIYLNVGTAQGGASLGNFYLYGYPVF